jgi:hypothetical protein
LIVTALGNNGGTPYAAKLCNDYQVDSQGNTPCEAGNACYSDWFLPAIDQLECLYANRVTIGGFAANLYQSSTEDSSLPASGNLVLDFNSGGTGVLTKTFVGSARCVRAN